MRPYKTHTQARTQIHLHIEYVVFAYMEKSDESIKTLLQGTFNDTAHTHT